MTDAPGIVAVRLPAGEGNEGRELGRLLRRRGQPGERPGEIAERDELCGGLLQLRNIAQGREPVRELGGGTAYLTLLQDELDEASVFIGSGVDVPGVGQHRGQPAVRSHARWIDRHCRPEQSQRGNAVSSIAEQRRTITQGLDLARARDLT